MKTNLKFNLGGIKVQGVEVRDINVEVGAEYSIGEVRGCLKIAKDVVKGLPEVLVDLKKAYDKFEEVSAEAEAEKRDRVINSLKKRVVAEIKHAYKNPKNVVSLNELSEEESFKVVNQNGQKVIYTSMEQDKIFGPKGIDLTGIFHETVLLNEALEIFSAITRNKVGQIILVKDIKEGR